MIVQHHRQAAELAQKLRGQRLGFRRNGGRPVNDKQRNLQLLRQRQQHVARRDKAQIDQNLTQLIAALALQFERAVQVLASNQVFVDQDFAKPHGR